MSSYYHAFVPGFNWWYIVAPIMTLRVVYIGIRMFRLTRSSKVRIILDTGDSIVIRVWTIGTVFSTGDLTASCVWASLVFGVMLAKESMSGMIQLCDNFLTRQDSPMWTLLLYVPVLFTMMVFTYGACTYFIGKFASKMKYRYLCHVIEEKTGKKTRTRHSGLKP